MNLSPSEIELLLTAIEITTAHIRADPEPGLSARPFVRLGHKMSEELLSRVCRHCLDQPTRRSNRLCDPCNAYRARYGRLPGPDVLERRAQRRIA